MNNSRRYSHSYKPFRAGMVGGGEGSFAGPVHRMAMHLGGDASLVAGALEEDPANVESTGQALRLSRVYTTYREMLNAEKALSDAERIDLVVIATPNNLHYEIASLFLAAGIPVVCEKPFTHTLPEAERLLELAESTSTPLMVSHNYCGYPLIKEAHMLVKQGVLGEIRQVFTSYIQGWLLPPLETNRMRQIRWRIEPESVGLSTCLTDIGSHAEHLSRYISGLNIHSVCADLTRSEGMILDDSAAVLVRYDNGAKGVYNISQTSAGEENDLHIRIYGSKAGLEWKQMKPNTLLLKRNGGPIEIIRAGSAYLCAEAQAVTRLPAGHPEAFIEAFANLYVEFFRLLEDRRRGESKSREMYDIPTAEDGVKTMAFIEAAVESDKRGQSWVKLKTPL